MGVVSVAAWADLPWLQAGFSTRLPGRSMAYGPREQNLGWTPEDDPAAVSQNRLDFLHRVAGGFASVPSLLTVRQIHSGIVHDLSLPEERDHSGGHRQGTASLEAATLDAPLPLEGDGLITAQPGQLLGILTADCVPVLIADRHKRVVAAFHAGWRGTLARVVETGAGLLRSRHGSRPEDLVAAIGPSIRPCCFEVGSEVRTSFAKTFPYAAELFTRGELQGVETNPHLDLQEANRRQLMASGVAADQIHTVAECTSCCLDPEGRRKYFSYRAEGGVTGRMLSVIGVAGVVGAVRA